jgi:hypothetical protein
VADELVFRNTEEREKAGKFSACLVRVHQAAVPADKTVAAHPVLAPETGADAKMVRRVWRKLNAAARKRGPRRILQKMAAAPPPDPPTPPPKMPTKKASKSVKIMHKCFQRDTVSGFFGNGERSEGHSSPDLYPAPSPTKTAGGNRQNKPPLVPD